MYVIRPQQLACYVVRQLYTDYNVLDLALGGEQVDSGYVG